MNYKGTKYVPRVKYFFFVPLYMQAHMQLMHPHSLAVGSSPSSLSVLTHKLNSRPVRTVVLSRYPLTGTIFSFFALFLLFLIWSCMNGQGRS